MVNGAVVCLPVPAEGDVVRDSRVVWSPLALPTQPDAQYVSPKAELVLEAGRGQTPLYSFDEVLTTIRYQGRPDNLLRNDKVARVFGGVHEEDLDIGEADAGQADPGGDAADAQ